MKIINILEDRQWEYDNSSFEGYVIVLEDGSEIKVGIDDSQQCCEQAGYLTSSDHLQDFIGEEFISISLVDTPIIGIDLKSIEVDEGSCMFVNIETSNGILQLVCYNEHNGYYSHEVVVISRELNHKSYL